MDRKRFSLDNDLADVRKHNKFLEALRNVYSGITQQVETSKTSANRPRRLGRRAVAEVVELHPARRLTSVTFQESPNTFEGKPVPKDWIEQRDRVLYDRRTAVEQPTHNVVRLEDYRSQALPDDAS